MGLGGSICVGIYLPPQFLSLHATLSLSLALFPQRLVLPRSSQLLPSDLAHLIVDGICLSPSPEFAYVLLSHPILCLAK